MSSLTPDQIAQKWATNLAGATETIKAGIQAVSVAPGQAAARQAQAYIQGVQAAQQKWQRNVSAVSLTEWQQATIDKGVNRIATGAQAAQPKMQSFLVKLLPYQQNLKGSLPARGGLEANIARMDAWVRGMAKFQNA